MKDVKVKVGLRVIYNGSVIEWSDGMKLKQGKYVVTYVNEDRNLVKIKSDRKNAVTEYTLYLSTFKPKQLEWDDVTNFYRVAFFTSRVEWAVNDDELFKKARKYNRG
jgi:hypothetical protein